jgi:hypothetical protein
MRINNAVSDAHHMRKRLLRLLTLTTVAASSPVRKALQYLVFSFLSKNMPQDSQV